MNEPKMKAYTVTDKREYMYSTVVFAETRGKAIALAMHTDACEDCEFTDILARRIPALDKYYRGRNEMDWFDAQDRIAMVRDGNYSCSYEVDVELKDCKECPAHECCERYERIAEVRDMEL